MLVCFWKPLTASGALWEPPGASGTLWERLGALGASGGLEEPLGAARSDNSASVSAFAFGKASKCVPQRRRKQMPQSVNLCLSSPMRANSANLPPLLIAGNESWKT